MCSRFVVLVFWFRYCVRSFCWLETWLFPVWRGVYGLLLVYAFVLFVLIVFDWLGLCLVGFVEF